VQSQAVWQQAMNEELKALTENHMWSVLPLPAEKQVVGFIGYLRQNLS
jgi:hypothetical protein